MTQYDAVLKNWQLVQWGELQVVCGIIYDDTKGRFRDGDQVRTSYVVSLDRETGLLRTRNTVYKLENEYQLKG